jgi:cyanate permease
MARGGAAGGGASAAQPASSIPTIAAMWLILLEALGALALLAFIVWWTMFSGRKKGERRDD